MKRLLLPRIYITLRYVSCVWSPTSLLANRCRWCQPPLILLFSPSLRAIFFLVFLGLYWGRAGGPDRLLSQRLRIPIPIPIGHPLLTSFLVVDLCVTSVHRRLYPRRAYPCCFLLFSTCLQSSEVSMACYGV